MSYTKYIMRKDGKFAFISKYAGVEHRVLAEFLGATNHVKSAGFLYTNTDGTLQAYGQSISLTCKCDENDGVLITAALQAGEISIIENDRAGFFYATNSPMESDIPFIVVRAATLADLLTHKIISEL